MAVINNDIEELQRLLATPEVRAEIGKSDWPLWNDSPLHRLAENGNLDAIGVLCEAGADPNSFYDSWTPLFSAVCYCAETKIRETILSFGARTDVPCNGTLTYDYAEQFNKGTAFAVLKGKDDMCIFESFALEISFMNVCTETKSTLLQRHMPTYKLRRTCHTV